MNSKNLVVIDREVLIAVAILSIFSFYFAFSNIPSTINVALQDFKIKNNIFGAGVSGIYGKEKELGSSVSDESPFAIHELSETNDYLRGDNNAFSNIVDLGVKWTRIAGSNSAGWGLVEIKNLNNDPNNLGNPANYNWSRLDRVAEGFARNGVHILWNINSLHKVDLGYLPTIEDGKPMPNNMEAYKTFVFALAERYDGDGIDDVPGSWIVDHFQIGNELANVWGGTLEEYAQLLEVSYNEIKRANPNAKVALAGLGNSQDLYEGELRYTELFHILNGKKVFDILDIHWFGLVGQYKEDPYGAYNLVDLMNTQLPATLRQYGYENVDIWFTEVGTHSGLSVSGQYNLLPPQTEREQAGELLKRYVHFIANGVDKVFWAQVMEGRQYSLIFNHNDYFDNSGLVYNGVGNEYGGSDDLGEGVKKVSFFTYKLMVEKLEGSDWNTIKSIQQSDGVYTYKFINKETGKPTWVIWNDNSDPITITLNVGNIDSVKISEALPKYETGKEITNYSTAFREEIKSASDEKVAIMVNEIPVFVEWQ